MNKQEFLSYLRKKLRPYGKVNAEDAVSYYSEIIDDKVTDGMSEKDAVASLGDPREIIGKATSEMVENNKIKSPSGAANVVIFTLLSPVLMPFAVLFLLPFIILFITWVAVSISFVVSVVAVIVGGFYLVFTMPNTGVGLIMLGGSLIAATLLALLTSTIFLGGKKFFHLITVKLIRKLRKKQTMRADK